MHDAVKKYADSKNVKGLKYVFIDALDVDPTFEKYREDFDYCRQLGLFESHREVSPMKNDQSVWDIAYWKMLKRDLLENFSEKRLQHMMTVAKVIYADKIRRRQEAETMTESAKPRPVMEQVRPSTTTVVSNPPQISRSEQEQRNLAEKRRKLAEENRKIEEQQSKKVASPKTTGAYHTKKVSGTVPAAVLAGAGILAAIVLFLLLRK